MQLTQEDYLQHVGKVVVLEDGYSRICAYSHRDFKSFEKYVVK